MDQPGKVANPARGQLNRENDIPLSPCVSENLVSRDGFSRPVPRQPAHLQEYRTVDSIAVRERFLERRSYRALAWNVVVTLRLNLLRQSPNTGKYE